ncbi:MAG: aspartate--tRNA ligase [Clostridia bacterium]|nr:aspartate--tRNA ligase [Clostridiales bacterium]MDD7165537.1 aspartate--tRNA ligase [Clostridia bacterium]MDY2900533.1 aspartate--tRNA ligase [Christensenellaceae bacterium]
MSEFMGNLRRNSMCGTLRSSDVGKEVTVMGWTQRRRNLGSLIFVDLRDKTGLVQVVFDDTTDEKVFEKAQNIRSEYVLAVKGKVRERESKTNKIATGEIEILADELKILSEADTTPFEILDDSNVNETLRLKYRYLDLRRPSLQKNLFLRNEITKAARRFFDENGFVEVETPMLGRSTPEGARDYLVPSRVHEGCFYALPQSPQLYKQLLMIAGFDRYYQITKCFRDEDLRANRQPEFTQIDVEMSFVEEVEDVMYPIEGLIKNIFKSAIGMDLGEGHFRTMTYRDAMENYGSDKPDTRFGLKIVNCSDLFANSEFKVFADALKIEIGPIRGSVRAINAKGLADKFSRKELDATVEYAKTLGAKGLCWMTWAKGGEIKSSFAKFLTPTDIENIKARMNFEEGDVLFFAADKDYVVFNTLGGIRLMIADKHGLIDKDVYDILWITEFPMFEWSEEENRYMAVHHPFTAPMNEDLELCETDPSKARAKAYDLVINGQESGGGSIRIHSRDIQKKMFNILGFSEDDIEKKFGFFVDAFNYGAPPHGGLAFGLDRLTMLLSKDDSIRDVIAFPKVQTASCLMSSAPAPVEQKQLDELYIEVKKD